MLAGLLDGNCGTLSASPSRVLEVALQSLRVAVLPGASRLLLSIMLLGSWNSIHMYRRPLMVLFQKLHGLCDFRKNGTSREASVSEPLSRTAAQELQLPAILVPMATTGLRSQVSPMVAALDAFPSAGAIADTQVNTNIASALHCHSDRKGTFSHLESQAQAVLREKGLLSSRGNRRCFRHRPRTLTRRGTDAFVYDVPVPCLGSMQICEARLQSGLAVSPPFGDWDSAWLHCSDVDFLDFPIWLLVDERVNFVLLYASRTRRRVLGLSIVLVSWSEECATLKGLCAPSPREGFPFSRVNFPYYNRGKLAHSHVFARARTALHEFNPGSGSQPVQEGFSRQALAYLSEFARQEVLSLSEAAASLVETKRGCEWRTSLRKAPRGILFGNGAGCALLTSTCSRAPCPRFGKSVLPGEVVVVLSGWLTLGLPFASSSRTIRDSLLRRAPVVLALPLHAFTPQWK